MYRLCIIFLSKLATSKNSPNYYGHIIDHEKNYHDPTSGHEIGCGTLKKQFFQQKKIIMFLLLTDF